MSSHPDLNDVLGIDPDNDEPTYPEFVTCWECNSDGIDPANGDTCWRCRGKGEVLEP